MDPPYVPVVNPCGAYVRYFSYKKDSKAPKTYLNFEGVDSCFYVWVNGSFVGYSQVSHSTSEFDVTELLREGENTLAVLVVKWCDGSYFEDQDKFRMSGIFRDVYLLNRPENGIQDYFVKAILLRIIRTERSPLILPTGKSACRSILPFPMRRENACPGDGGRTGFYPCEECSSLECRGSISL